MTRPDSAANDRRRPPDTDAVVAALEAGLAAHDGRPRRVERIGRRVSDYSTSFTIEELDVTLDGGERRRLVLKDLAWGSLLGEASAVRPRFLYDPRREVAVYQSLLAGRGLGTATCYAAVSDAAADRHWLFLEHVAGAQLCHVGDLGAWEDAARWLARLHATFAPDAGLAGRLHAAAGPSAVPLLRHDRDFYLLWPARAEALLRPAAGGAVYPAAAHPAAGRFARLVRGYGQVADRLAGMAPTLIHGEFYPANVLVADAPRRICPIDWEMAAVGPGLLDLAALTAGNWTDDDRAAMVTAYHAALADAGGPATSLAELNEALEWCRLHVAVQWLGWAANWTAPAEQAQDWLGQAVAIGERLGL